MTYKELADKLGVKKDRVRYVAEHLNLPNATYRVDGVIHMTPAAVNMVMAEIDRIPREDSAVFTYVHSEISQCETAESPQNGAESCENSVKSDEKCQDSVESDCEQLAVALTFIDHYKTVIASQTAQLAAKDAQIQKYTEFASAAMSDLNKQLTDANTAHVEQLTAKDAQLSRMQDTVDALTKQLADAAERERQLQATLEQRLEQSREQPRKWWMWWKR